MQLPRGRSPSCVPLGMSVYLSGLRVFISKIQGVGEARTLTPLDPSSSNLWGGPAPSHSAPGLVF